MVDPTKAYMSDISCQATSGSSSASLNNLTQDPNSEAAMDPALSDPVNYLDSTSGIIGSSATAEAAALSGINAGNAETQSAASSSSAQAARRRARNVNKIN